VQQKIVLDAMLELGDHPTVEEIYSEIHKEHPSISKTTIYRNLRQLAENEIIHQVSLLDGLERYDERTSQHYHFKCKNCGFVLDIDIEYIEGVNDSVRRAYDVQVDEHDVIFSGICQKCKKVDMQPE
jgi:Fur family peroxide stress response transcriptional regulator